MLTAVTDTIWSHQSDFCQSNSIVIKGDDGVMLIDPGITTAELECLRNDLQAIDLQVTIGFSTHPHWDHLLWEQEFGNVPRYATASNHEAIQNVLARPDWRDLVTSMLPSTLTKDIPLNEEFGKVTALESGVTTVPWNGPTVEIIEHNAHADGHAALFVPDQQVLICGDMLSDILIPIFNFRSDRPIDDYLAGIERLKSISDGVLWCIPGHGLIAQGADINKRIKQDKAYVEALRDHLAVSDTRLGPTVAFPDCNDIHANQVGQLST